MSSLANHSSIRKSLISILIFCVFVPDVLKHLFDFIHIFISSKILSTFFTHFIFQHGFFSSSLSSNQKVGQWFVSLFLCRSLFLSSTVFVIYGWTQTSHFSVRLSLKNSLTNIPAMSHTLTHKHSFIEECDWFLFGVLVWMFIRLCLHGDGDSLRKMLQK